MKKLLLSVSAFFLVTVPFSITSFIFSLLKSWDAALEWELEDWDDEEL